MKISPSKLAVYRQCPRRYRYHYLDGLAAEFAVDHPALSVGESVHRALCAFFREPDGSRRTREELQQLLRRHWKREGYRDVEEERAHGLKALEMLDRYWYRHEMTAHPFLLEYSFTIPVGNHVITGKIDRVDRRDGGCYTIIDYKTGTHVPSAAEAKADEQLTFYALAFRKQYGVVPDRLELHYLAPGVEVVTTRTAAELEEAVAAIGAVADRIRDERDYPARANPFCRWCPYGILCPVAAEKGESERDRLDATNRRLYTLLTAATELAQSELKVELVLDRALAILTEVGKGDQAGLFWTTADKTVVQGGRFAGLTADEEHAFSARPEVVKTLAGETPLLDNHPPGEGTGDQPSHLYLPLKTRQQCWGILYLRRPPSLPFSPADYVHYQALALQVAVALENAIHYRQAICDGMTGLYNHAHFQALLNRELRQGLESGRPVSLFMFDIDNFKKFNDTYGHQTGDLVLKETARVVREAVRAGDWVARYGGEEFGVILPNAPAAEAYAIADRIRSLIEQNVLTVEGVALGVTISGGVGTFPDNADGTRALVEVADQGLYASKRSGKNRVSIAKP